MGAKKNPGRFTLHFNLEDPQQRTVSELLEQQGRHKAQFITSAILRYMQSPRLQESNNTPPTIDKDVLEEMLLSIMEKHPQFAAALSGTPVKTEEPLAQTTRAIGTWNSPIGDDAMKAISETLTAFQQG